MALKYVHSMLIFLILFEVFFVSKVIKKIYYGTGRNIFFVCF